MQLILVLIITVVSTVASAKGVGHYKDGRQYYLDLAHHMDMPDTELYKTFFEVRSNVPRHGTIADLTSGMDGLAKIATAACAFTEQFNDRPRTIEGLYTMILDRTPTEIEKSRAVRNQAGKLLFFPNCFYLALHPEFLTLRKNYE